MLAVNVTGVYLCAQAEAEVMLAAGYGKIINTASMSGSIVNTPQYQSAYNTSKAAVIHLTKSLAAEWAPRGIRVNCISPGYTRTLLVEDLLETPEGQAVMPRWMAMTPMGKMAEVTDLQGAVVYLAREVSDFMTGATWSSTAAMPAGSLLARSFRIGPKSTLTVRPPYDTISSGWRLPSSRACRSWARPLAVIRKRSICASGPHPVR